MSVKTVAKAVVGAVSLGAATALGFLPHTDPWFNVLAGVVGLAGVYGIYAVPNKDKTPRQEAISAAVGAVASDVASHFLPPAPHDVPAPAKTFPAEAVAAVTAPPAPDPLPVAAPVDTAPATVATPPTV